jgi:hypothetical protein
LKLDKFGIAIGRPIRGMMAAVLEQLPVPLALASLSPRSA